MPRRWFVTAVLRPLIPLAGPYESYDDCSAQCVVRADREVAARALAAGRLPGHYVPRLFEVRVETRHLYRAPEAQSRAVPKPGRSPGTDLPPQVYAMPRGALVMLAKALGVGEPPQGADRAGIIAHIERGLAALER